MFAYNLDFQKNNGYNLVARREIIKQPTSLDEFIRQAKKAQEKSGEKQITLSEFIRRYKKKRKQPKSISEYIEQQKKPIEETKLPETIIIEQQPDEENKENRQIATQIPAKNKFSWWLWGLLGLGLIYILSSKKESLNASNQRK